jgi:hypothetical protein
MVRSDWREQYLSVASLSGVVRCSGLDVDVRCVAIGNRLEVRVETCGEKAVYDLDTLDRDAAKAEIDRVVESFAESVLHRTKDK